jgi:peroxiredoxin
MAQRRKTGTGGPRWLVDAALWLGVLALLAWRFAPQVAAAAGWDGTAQPAPRLTLQLLDGRVASLGGGEGRVVLINFWATWCPPCRAEIPGFQDVYEALHDGGFDVLGISTDDRPVAEVQAWLRDRGITYPVAMATPEAVAGFGGIASLPTSFLIDHRGNIRYRVSGFFTETALRAAVNRLLAERGR